MKIYLTEDSQVFGKLEVDYYVPINVTFGEGVEILRDVVWYRYINKNHSFIEVGINSVARKLTSITFVSINDVEFSDMKLEIINSVENCNPCFDITMFEGEQHITEKIDFRVIVKPKEVMVLFSYGKEFHNEFSLGYISFLTDEENLVKGLKFQGFSDEEWKEFNEAIERATKMNRTK